MIIFQLFLVTLIMKICYSEFIPVFQAFNPHPAPLVPVCSPPLQQQPEPQLHQPLLENTTAMEEPKDKLKFILPFMDMEIQSDRNLHVMHEVQKQQIYILHGHELYQMFINRQEKRLSLVAVLEGSVRHVEPLGAKMICWQGNLLLVIVLEEHLEVYQLAEDVLMQRAEVVKDPARMHEKAPIFEAIQQLTLTGRFQKLFLFSATKERVMLVAAVNFIKLYGKLRMFEWFNTYFDPIEDIILPSISVVNVIGSETKYLITGSAIKHQPRTILAIYEVSSTSLNLLHKQTLTVESYVVHIFSYLHLNIIVACSSEQQTCSSFRQMPDGRFRIYKRRTSKELAFELMTSSSRFVSAIRQNEVMIFTNHRLDCYSSFMSEQMDVTSLIGYQNAYREDYVLLVYKRPFKALVRIVELEITGRDLSSGLPIEPEEILASNNHHFFESTIGQLRRLLLHRKMDMDKFSKISQFLRPKLRDLKVKERIVLHAGNVGVIKITGDYLKSPKQLVHRIEILRQNYLPQRSKRSDNKKLFNASLEITNRVQIRRMKVENLIYHGDVLEGFSLNQTANLNQNILTVKPTVTTQAINAAEVIFPQNFRPRRQQIIPDLFFHLTPSVHIIHLRVDYINGVPWNAFYSSLFLKNRDNIIEGRLMLQSQVKVKHLMTTVLNGLDVSKLFNLKHPQVINSDLIISRLFVPDLKAKSVNGLIFEEDIVFSGNDTVIETPVIMHHLNISADLLLANNAKVEHITANPDALELKQFYINKIIMNGSLIVNNLKTLNNETKIILGDQDFDENTIREKYLLREQAQNFSFPVVFEEAKVIAPSLSSNYLNEHQTSQHMLVDKMSADKPLLVIFMNAHIKGDIKCRDYKSKIVEINENIIHPGDKVHIRGIKLFEAPLEVNHVEVFTLNHLNVNDLVFKTDLKDQGTIKFKDSKTFNALKVTNPSLIEQELQAAYLNNLPLESLLSNDYYMERLNVRHLVETTNLVFHKINGIPFDEFFSKLDVKDEPLLLHKDLIVEGNVQFAENLELNYLNDIPWNEYVDNLVRANENAIVEGEVSFVDDLTITEKFEANGINSYDLEIILKSVLMKTKPQLITGSFRFDNITGSNIDVLQINNVHVSEFVDLSRSFTEIEGDMIVENLYIGRNLLGNWNDVENILVIKEKVNQLTLKPWTSLYVLYNCSWPENIKDNSQQLLLKYLYKSAVKDSHDQTITGNVKISKPLITNMQTHFKFLPNLDIDFIQQDAVLKNSSLRQIIKGKKVFLKPLSLENLKAKHNINTKFLNNIDVLRFNQSLYRLTSQEPLKGLMNFRKPLTVGHLQVKGLLNGLNTTLIYQLEPNCSLPDLQLQELYIENDLHVKNINDMSLSYFLDNRLTLKGPALEHFGVLIFENLVIEKEALLQSINGIAITDMVFKHSPYLQTIKGHKSIEHTLELAGPAHVMHLNDKDLIELYRNCLMKEQNYEFDNLLLEQATFENGLQVVRNINYNPQQRSFQEIADQDDNIRKQFLIFLIEFNENLTYSHKDIIYLDYDLDAHIKWLDSDNLRTNQTIYYELSRISCCEKQYIQISFEYPNNMYLKNITSNRLTKISNKISIKAENFCTLQKRKVKSKVTFSGPKLLKVFGMKRYIETIYTLQIKNSSEQLIILHVLDLPSLKRNEVRIFKISTRFNSILEWQGLTQQIGEQLKLYELYNLHILLTNGLIDHHPALKIYHYNNHSQLFKVQQIIDGNYDIMEMIDLPDRRATKQLILSCEKCQRIFIYELNSSNASGKYEILQIITLKSLIDKLVVFSVKNESYMLVISQRDSNFYNIYKYAYIQGWLHLTFGYFPNLQMSIPITELWNTGNNNLMYSKNSDGIPLILLCNQNDCYLVKAII